jgi:hypothetical protein
MKLMIVSGEAVMEKVRRYRAIASLHRQTAAFRPHQSWSLLEQAEQWERLAVEQLEAYFDACGGRHDDEEPRVVRYATPRWESTVAREAELPYLRSATRWDSASAMAA